MVLEAIILVVDDDRNTREVIGRALRGRYEVLLAESAAQALVCLEERPVDLMLTDLRMPGEDGLSLLHQALTLRRDLKVILLSAYGTVETAVEAMRNGAYTFLSKPINLDHLEVEIGRALESIRLERENRRLREQVAGGIEGIIGTSAPLRRIFDIIKQAAPTDATVLIQGASGTGKELVARALHNLSRRASAPFIPVHCAALSPTLLESELFGHEKGAFTGATARHIGRFEQANGGTLFLDEISEIDPSTQVKLLRVIQERRFVRVGGVDPIDLDVRFIAATNRHLRQWVQEGKFREDLYFRLNVVDISLPTLSERADDIPLLCMNFLKEFNQTNGRHITGFTPETMRRLCHYSWPGNIRELRNTIERMVVLASGETLGEEDLPDAIRNDACGETQTNEPTLPDDAHLLRPSNRYTEDELTTLIPEAMATHKGKKAKVARALGISRSTLYRKLRQLGFNEDELHD